MKGTVSAISSRQMTFAEMKKAGIFNPSREEAEKIVAEMDRNAVPPPATRSPEALEAQRVTALLTPRDIRLDEEMRRK